MDIKEARQFVSHLESLRADRLMQWRKLADHILPHRGLFSGEGGRNAGARRMDGMINNAALRSLRRGAAGMAAGMTPAALPWFKHDFVDPAHREVEGARAFADMVDERIGMVLSMGRFYQSIHSFDMELIGFGCALLYAEGSPVTVARFDCPTVGTYAVGLDDERNLDAVARRLRFGARHAGLRFGLENLSPAARRDAEKNPYAPVELVHVARRRAERDPDKMDARNMPVQSLWYEEGGQNILLESGYNEMPYMFATWEDARSIYGTGPGDDALGDARQIDAMERRKLLGLDKIINPPIVKPSSLKSRVSTLPGAETALNTDMERTRLGALYEINFGPALQYVQQEIQNVAGRIDDTLMATVFADTPIELRPKGISATEWAGRRRERLQMMGPTLAAYEPNVLSRVLERVFGLLDRAGLLPPPPRGLGPMAALDVEYLSPLSQALRSTTAESTMAFLGQIIPVLDVNQQAADKIDVDQIIDELARGNGAPASIVRSDEAVARMRKARAEEQAQAMRRQEQLQLVERAAGLASTPVGPGTLAGSLMGAESGGAAG